MISAMASAAAVGTKRPFVSLGEDVRGTGNFYHPSQLSNSREMTMGAHQKRKLDGIRKTTVRHFFNGVYADKP
jgi:hypothetical protein